MERVITVRGRRLRSAAAVLATSASLVAASSASAADGPCYSPPVKPKEIAHVKYTGMKSYTYCYGPITIKPGQNTISTGPALLLPKEPGYITRFDPNLLYTDKKLGKHGVPGVDVLHLHHGVWITPDRDLRWASGEEKTILQLPKGFGWRNDGSGFVAVNHMIHNLFPTQARVYLEWKIDFVPDTASASKTIKTIRAPWLDVANGGYPVFNALRQFGTVGKYTYPADVPKISNPTLKAKENSKIGGYRWTVPRDLTLVSLMGHLHPGGLSTNMTVTRNGVTKPLFTSAAHYWEPAGAVSWDVAMTVPKSNWRVKLKAGDVLTLQATYDVAKASWYEVMGLDILYLYYGSDGGGTDPFAPGASIPTTGVLTHGHLEENDTHGGKTTSYPNATSLPNGSNVTGGTVGISNFVTALGDLTNTGSALNPPTVTQGQSFTFQNNDSTGNARTDYIFHTITACAAPCNKDTGIAYPRADGAIEFDSGELGFGPSGNTPTENTKAWTVPNDLPKGTYTYFCRVHPYMRGAFRVVPG